MPDPSPLRHYGGFVVAGGTAFVTDVAVFHALNSWAGINLLIARFLSITVAMIVSFLINRAITFAMPGAPRIVEFLRFAAVGWVSSALNYALFACTMLARPETAPVIAIAFATAISMVVSYLGMRLAVFRKA